MYYFLLFTFAVASIASPEWALMIGGLFLGLYLFYSVIGLMSFAWDMSKEQVERWVKVGAVLLVPVAVSTFLIYRQGIPFPYREEMLKQGASETAIMVLALVVYGLIKKREQIRELVSKLRQNKSTFFTP